MDELLIEDKKYVSSKRAAKMTGYAKDYIGQLCREGRVSARLVGRSWYVLESAIQDHRFGSEIQPEEAMKAVFSPELPTAEPQRHQTTPEEFLPPINRLREAAIEAENTEETKAAEHLIDSWRDWFDRIADTEKALSTETEVSQEEIQAPEVIAQAVVTENSTEEPESTEEELKEEPVEVNVPVRTLYQQPPEELLPRNLNAETRFQEESDEPIVEQDEEVPVSWIRDNRVLRGIQVGSVIFAAVLAVVAFVGTGYLDKYIISSNQVGIIAGVGVYNK